MTQESIMQFPFEATTKDGWKATVLGATPDCRLAGYIDLTEEGFGFELSDWDSDGSHSDPKLSITLPLQIKRRPVLTPPYEQLLALLAAATPGEADAIRSAARRANIEVPE